MLQFFDRINSKKGFVDMHIHTDDSYGDEMNQMNFSPEDLLDSVKMYADENYCDATIAITDHNSIEGVQKITEKMKNSPEEYKNVRFISGCEFTCSGGSLGTVINSEGHRKNLVKNFHMLAYGFDPYDKDLNFLCRLYSTRDANAVVLRTKNGYLKVPAGAYVMSLKTILKDKGINLSIKDLSDINIETNEMESPDYVRYLMTYVEKFGLSEEVKRDIRTQLLDRNVDQLGKPDCMEVMEIVENAGGYCVLAHPMNLQISSAYKKNPDQAMRAIKSELRSYDVYFENDESLKSLLIKYVIYSLSNAAHSLDTDKQLNGIVGVETLHTSSLFNAGALEHIVKCAKDNNLYMTVGGDSHGELHESGILSKFMPSECNTSRHKNDIVVTDCLLAERILDGSIKSKPRCSEEFDDQFKILQTLYGEEIDLDFDQIKAILSSSLRNANTHI